MFYREFFYIQMEKYARQALSEGVKSDTELNVTEESELYRVINVHYNRNNHIEVSQILLNSIALNTTIINLLSTYLATNHARNIQTIQFSRFLIASDGLLNKLSKSSLSQFRQEKIWIPPGKNRYTK